MKTTEKRIVFITAHEEYIDRQKQEIGLRPVGIIMYSNLTSRAIKNGVSSEMLYISYN